MQLTINYSHSKTVQLTMKMKSKLFKNAVMVLTLLLSATMSANDVRKLIPIRADDDGNPPPPGTPIDGYIYVLVVIAVVLAAYYTKITKVRATK